MNSGQRSRVLMGRMKHELKLLENPPYGICAYLKEDSNIQELEAKIQGPKDSPYEKGTFKLSVKIPDKFPIEPPSVRFITPIYHPNIDESGRICFDGLKLPPHGGWKPSINIGGLLASIQVLMDQPNTGDALMIEISTEYENQRNVFNKRAREHTRKYAMGDVVRKGNESREQGKSNTQRVVRIEKRKEDDRKDDKKVDEKIANVVGKKRKAEDDGDRDKKRVKKE